MSASQTARPFEVLSRFLPDRSSAQIDALLQCMDLALLRERLQTAGMCPAEIDEEQALEAYVTREECRHVSPNALFSERFYRERYADVAAFVKNGGCSGFVHFVTYGIFEGRWPNGSLAAAAASFEAPLPAAASIDAAAYLAKNAAARAFVSAFPIVSGFDHFDRFGRYLHLQVSGFVPEPENETAMLLQQMEREFDAAWYAAQYLDGTTSQSDRNDPFGHYLSLGIARSYSPSSRFEEDWYCAYYADVGAAVPGEFMCGFQHYLTAGRAEGRMPYFDLTGSLEDQIPGVTKPILLEESDSLRDRFFREGLRASRRPDDGGPPTIWFLLPHFNPDISFGGYRACFELMRALRGCGANVAVYCTRSHFANLGYFLWRQGSERLHDTFADMAILPRYADHRIGIGPRDRIVAFTVMDIYLARELALWTDFERPYLLTQEYEPIFFDHSSSGALAREAYAVPHYAIVNSTYLYDYLRLHRVGVFGGRREAVAYDDYAVFEHRINQLPRQSPTSMGARSGRTLAFYARPERHATRNLFEMGLIALQNLCRAGVFGEEWSFVGLGAMSEIEPIELGRGHRLVIYKRTSEEEYTELIHSLDIGVSLMYAPHPGVVAFEFATTGALVVTNTYENRSAIDLRAISGNIVPCEPTLADLERAILEAVRRVDDYDARARDALRPDAAAWDEIFSPAFVRRVFGIGDPLFADAP